jgi:Holliday junction resolvase RusA-like endonuclease
MKTVVNFTVLGRPQPGGSKRAVPVPGGKIRVIDANRKVKPWRDSVAAAAQEAMGDKEPLTGPLGLGLTFFIQRPQSHYTKVSERISRGAPRRPITRPDLTKYIRAVEDACTSILWRDDSQVVTQVCRKFYGSPERCEVVVQQVVSE